MFVAVASNGGGITSSADGKTWTDRGNKGDFESVCWGNGMFVAVSDASYTNNHVMTSTNGTSWNHNNLPFSLQHAWSSITFGNGVFVAVAWTGFGNRVMTSTNGSTWVSRDTPADNNWRSVAFGNGVFVAVADNDDGMDTRRVMTSSNNGNTWTMRESADDIAGWNSVTFGNGVFVAVSYDAIMRSSDNGTTWSLVQSPVYNPWLSVTFGKNLFVAVSWVGTHRVMISADNGRTWTLNSISQQSHWCSMAFGQNTFVGVASLGTQRVMRLDANAVQTTDVISSSTSQAQTPFSQSETLSSQHPTLMSLSEMLTSEAQTLAPQSNHAQLDVSGNIIVGRDVTIDHAVDVGKYADAGLASKRVRLLSGKVDFGSIGDFDARIAVDNNSRMSFNARKYTFSGAPVNNMSGVSVGRTKVQSYVLSPSVLTEAPSRREYDTSQRIWSGKVVKNNGMVKLHCWGNDSYPLYGTYVVFYATKSGTFWHTVQSCFRGSTSTPGNFGAITWRLLSSSMSSTAGLTVALGNAGGSNSFVPSISFTNTTNVHAWFLVSATVFDDATAFNESGV